MFLVTTCSYRKTGFVMFVRDVQRLQGYRSTILRSTIIPRTPPTKSIQTTMMPTLAEDISRTTATSSPPQCSNIAALPRITAEYLINVRHIVNDVLRRVRVEHGMKIAMRPELLPHRKQAVALGWREHARSFP